MAHVTDKCVRVDSGPVSIPDQPRSWDSQACLTEKQWNKLKLWVEENRERVQELSNLVKFIDHVAERVLAVAVIPAGQFSRWKDKKDSISRMSGSCFSPLEIEKEEKKLKAMKCHEYAEAGWTGCPLPPSALDIGSIQEGLKLAGL